MDTAVRERGWHSVVGVVLIAAVLSGAGLLADEGPTVAVAASGLVSLGEVVARLGEWRGGPLLVDARYTSTQLFVSAGEYPPDELLQALLDATGLGIRTVSDVHLICPVDPKLGNMLREVLISPGMADRLAATVELAMSRWDPSAEDIPLPREWFTEELARPFEALNAEQQQFVRHLAARYLSWGQEHPFYPASDFHNPVLVRQGGRDLTGETLRFGSCLSLVAIGYLQPGGPDAPIVGNWVSAIPIHHHLAQHLGYHPPNWWWLPG